jgi:hypothetical protein
MKRYTTKTFEHDGHTFYYTDAAVQSGHSSVGFYFDCLGLPQVVGRDSLYGGYIVNASKDKTPVFAPLHKLFVFDEHVVLLRDFYTTDEDRAHPHFFGEKGDIVIIKQVNGDDLRVTRISIHGRQDFIVSSRDVVPLNTQEGA